MKSGITFDAKQKIALSDKNYLNSILYSLLTFQIYEEKNRWEKYNIFFLLEYYAWFETKASSTHLDTRQCCNRVNSQMYRDMLCHHMQVWDYCILVSFPADRHHNSSNIHSTSPNCPSFHQLQKKMDGRDIIKTSFIFQQFLLDKHWIFDAYFCYIALPLTLLWLIQPKFLTFTNTTSSLALEILERGIIAVTLFLVVFAFLFAESIAV